jgi:hypothetical protein
MADGEQGAAAAAPVDNESSASNGVDEGEVRRLYVPETYFKFLKVLPKPFTQKSPSLLYECVYDVHFEPKKANKCQKEVRNASGDNRTTRSNLTTHLVRLEK